MNNKITAKQYLQQISRLDKMINNKLSEIYQLRTMATSITVATDSERVQTSGSKDHMGDSVAKMVDLENEAKELILQYTELRQKIISQIDNMPKEKHYSVLHLKYVDGKTFEEIAVGMGYTWRNIMYFHKDALEEFERLYGSDIKYTKLAWLQQNGR